MTLSRRSFLTGLAAVSVAAVVPIPKAIGGTITGRLTTTIPPFQELSRLDIKRFMYTRMYGGERTSLPRAFQKFSEADLSSIETRVIQNTTGKQHLWDLREELI